jgi:hemerythrin-like domain-containing protein
MATSRSTRKTALSALFATPAGFDDPLEMLLGCHRRIERQLETLKRLRTHATTRGVDAEASAAAQSLLKYFLGPALNHHADEEMDLFPLLEERITDPGEHARFAALRKQLERDHRELQSAWLRLRKPLEAIAEGLVRTLPDADVQAFVTAYARHMLVEEAALQEFFNRWLDDADRQTLGLAMAARRVAPPPRA